MSLENQMDASKINEKCKSSINGHGLKTQFRNLYFDLKRSTDERVYVLDSATDELPVFHV